MSFFIFFLIFGLLISESLNSDKESVRLINVKCHGDTNVIVNFTCYLKSVNWELTGLYTDGYLVRTIQNVAVHVQLYKKKANNRMQPFLVDVKENVCGLLSGRGGGFYTKFALLQLKNHSNLVHPCPFHPGRAYINNYTFSSEIVPSLIPMGSYRVDILLTEEPSIYLGKVSVYAEATPKRKNKRQ